MIVQVFNIGAPKGFANMGSITSNKDPIIVPEAGQTLLVKDVDGKEFTVKIDNVVLKLSTQNVIVYINHYRARSLA